MKRFLGIFLDEDLAALQVEHHVGAHEVARLVLGACVLRIPRHRWLGIQQDHEQEKEADQCGHGINGS